MPGIPVGDHYPESHTGAVPPQVPLPPVSGAESLSPSDIPLSRPQKLFRLTPQVPFLGYFMFLCTVPLQASGALDVSWDFQSNRRLDCDLTR